MEQDKIDMYIMQNAKMFPADKMMYIKEKLESMDDKKYAMLMSLDLKNPTIMFVISFFVGALGIDRFMLGDTTMGVLKLLTGGGCGIWALIDWFTIMNKTKEKNFEKIMQLL